MNFRDSDELTALAGEYVLGLFSPVEKIEFERELAINRELAKAVYYWQDRLLEVAPMPAPVAPAPGLWARIERDLAPPAPDRAAKPGLWASLNFWRFAGLVGALASLLLAWNLITGAPPVAPGQQYLAVLQTPDKSAGWLVEANARHVRLTPLTRTAAKEKQVLQFWTKPEGASGPTSLGLVPGDRITLIPASRLPGLGEKQLFEITLEPESGSPIGRPTGPILAVGRAVRL